MIWLGDYPLGTEKLAVTVMITLCTMLIILLTLRIIIAISGGKRRRPRTGVGKCMTIGDREVQEDNMAALETRMGLMAVLSDGMGKAYGGKIASRIAVETFVELFRGYNAFDNPQYYFRRAFSAANREILNCLDDGRGSASVAAVMIQKGKLFYAVVGNPKIAVYRGGDLVPVSQGHTIDILAKKRYEQGRISKESAVALLERHRLYNYVGQDGFHEIELLDTPLELRRGDTVALMSDGVYESLAWREIEEILSRGTDCAQQALEVIERINRSKKKNKDNASIVLVRV